MQPPSLTTVYGKVAASCFFNPACSLGEDYKVAQERIVPSRYAAPKVPQIAELQNQNALLLPGIVFIIARTIEARNR
jgi:hypothetical protein